MSTVRIGKMVLSMCATNCYFVYRGGSKECVVIDPADQGQTIYKTLQKNGFEVKGILITHGHFDHIWGLDALRDAVNAAAECDGLEPIKAYALDAEKEVLRDAYKNVSDQAGRPCTTSADKYLHDGDEITLADNITFKVIATPGHTIGGCCYYIEEAGILIAGDTLFEESVGRTDFPTGSMGTLVRSIKDKLFVLPDETRVYPGHGDSTTIGHEKENNPFVV